MSKKSGETTKRINIDALCKETLDKIKHHRTKNNTTDIEFYEVYKEFFIKYLDFDHEFSVQDLEEKIEKTYFDQELKTHLRRLGKEAEVIEYKDNPYSREELNELLDDFEMVVEKILDSHHEKKGFFTKLLGWFKPSKKHHIKPKAHKEKHEDHDKKNEAFQEAKPDKKVTVESEKKKSKSVKKDDKLTFKQKLDEALKLEDKEELQLIYDDLLEQYNNLSEEKQAMYYDELEEIYEKLIS